MHVGERRRWGSHHEHPASPCDLSIRRALHPNPRHGCSCAWRRYRRLLTRLALNFRFFSRKKGKTRWMWESNPERERRDEVTRMVRCVREDEEVDTLNLDHWMWVSKEREEIRSNLNSPF